MPFVRPTLAQLIDRVTADVSSRVLGVPAAVLRRSLLGVLARSEAGEAHMLYGYLEWIAAQAIPDTAEGPWLERWAVIWGLSLTAATYASGDLTITGTNGSTIADGTLWQRQDGVQYATQGAETISAGTATATLEAVVAGADGNLDAGTTLFLVSPISGVTASATVAAGGISGGSDSESDERLRTRLLERIAMPPQGGAERDYIAWAKAASSDVTRVWVTPNGMGIGTVVVQFVVDEDPGGLIPDAGQVDTVQDYIDARRPVTADVYVSAPTAVPRNMTIKISPNNASVQAAVTAELEDLFRRDAEPGGTIYISRIREAVSIATGEDNNLMVTPTADIVDTAGNISTLGTITFQSFP